MDVLRNRVGETDPGPHRLPAGMLLVCRATITEAGLVAEGTELRSKAIRFY